MSTLTIILSSYLIITTAYGHLHELDGSFLQLRRSGAWLVKFYAPWCGHCRKMEPAYKETAMRLHGSEIFVGRIDATQHVDVASHFEVRGYPTVKYINGDKIYTHYGDRSADGIMKFAKRAHRPAVTQLASVGAFQEAVDENTNDSMFLYIGSKSDDLYSVFEKIADDYHVKSSFYIGEVRILPRKITKNAKVGKSGSSIIVLKDNLEYRFKMASDDKRPVNESVRAWIDAERFTAYPRVSESGVWDFATTGKRVILFVVNSSETMSDEDKRFKDMGEKLALKHREEFHTLYHFGWMDDLSTASSLAMVMRLPTPNIVILHPHSEQFYLRADYYQPASNMSFDDVLKFLRDVNQGKVQPYGGKTVWARVKRLGFDLATGILDFIAASPLLALFVLGVPLGVVSLLIYLICCLEPASENDEFEDDEDNHYGNVIASHPLTEGPDGPQFHGDAMETTLGDKKND